MYGKIYRLDQGDLTFLGSTIIPRLRQRLSNHRRDFNRWLKTGLGYNSSFELFKNGSPTITLIESVRCASRAALRARQGYHQLQIKNININRAGNERARNGDWRTSNSARPISKTGTNPMTKLKNITRSITSGTALS